MISSLGINWPRGWHSVPLWSLFERIKDVGHPHEEMLSVYRDYGVLRKESRDDNFNKTAEDRNIYQLVDPGWLIVNRMKAWQGSVGITPYRGIVSGHYMCFRPRHEEHSGFLNWLLRSAPYAAEYYRLSRGVRPNQVEIDNEALRALPVHLPSTKVQRAIATFLDVEIARIDALTAKKAKISSLISERGLRRVYEAIRGTQELGDRRPSGLVWLGETPASWPVLAVASQFEVLLGKMLDAGKMTGLHLRPYLRNTNVQWDYVSTDDLLQMDILPRERSRFRVLPGDLLICEGGEPGRAAIWHGGIEEVYYQKALHRCRAKAFSLPRWLFYCLKAAVAMKAFSAVSSTTIAHLTGEQLRAQRFPFPDQAVQQRLVEYLDTADTHDRTLIRLIEQQINLLQEHRQALITGAVTGEIEVPGVSR